MFQFAGFPPYDYGFIIRWQKFFLPGFPIRIPADQWIFAPPRSFSQLITSFFGSWCQGIRPAPFVNLTNVEMGRLHGTSPAAQARLQTTVCAVEEAFLRNAYHEREMRSISASDPSQRYFR